MLGDNAEKSKNPLKKAMRRRNAKTVTFSSPTYFDAPEIDYSSEEEGSEKDNFFEEDEVSETESSAQIGEDESRDEDLVIEPLRPKQQHNQLREQQPQQQPPQQQPVRAQLDKDEPTSEPRTSLEQQNMNRGLGLTQGLSFIPQTILCPPYCAFMLTQPVLRRTDPRKVPEWNCKKYRLVLQGRLG
jgi:FtsZ-interacting cell division protein ZipA